MIITYGHLQKREARMHPSYPSSIKRPGKGRNAKCPEACSDGIDDDADDEETVLDEADGIDFDEEGLEVEVAEEFNEDVEEA